MARIGVISDTHGVLPVEAFNALADCEHIIHAGDICSPEIIRDLQTLAPVTAVLGNNDFNEYGTSVCRYARPVIDGVRFLVAHYPRDVRITFAGSGALAPGDPLPNVCIHGHTHVPEIVVGKEARPADLLLCPGSPTSPRGGSRNAWRRSTCGRAAFCAPGSSGPRAVATAVRSCCATTSRKAGRILVLGALRRKRVGGVHRGSTNGTGSGDLPHSCSTSPSSWSTERVVRPCFSPCAHVEKSRPGLFPARASQPASRSAKTPTFRDQNVAQLVQLTTNSGECSSEGFF